MESTIIDEVTFCGPTFYMKEYTSVTIFPMPAHTGIYINNIKLSPPNIKVIGNFVELGSVRLIEHLMSAFFALGINNAYIYVNGNAIPILDGCSRIFIDKLKDNVFIYKHKKEKYFIDDQIKVVLTEDKNDDLKHLESIRYICIDKGEFEIIGDVDYPYAGKQYYSFKHMDEYYEKICDVKTFMNIEFFDYYTKHKELYGIKNENIFVFDENTKFEGTELVRHKILDVLGDILCLQFDIIGKISFSKTGHSINKKLVDKIYKRYQEDKTRKTKIIKITSKEALKIIKNNDMVPYFGLNHFSFDVSIYTELFLIEEEYKYIFSGTPFDHWSPLCVYTNNFEKDSNYLPYHITQIKNCILYKINDKIRSINGDIRYYWGSKCNFEKFLDFRDTISKKARQHFPSTRTYKKLLPYMADYEFDIIPYNYDIFEQHYDILKKEQHLPACNIPISKINKPFLKLALLRKEKEVVFIAIFVDRFNCVSVLNLASASGLIGYNVGYGFYGCIALFKYCCDNKYDYFDLCVSREYGCYKNKLCVERYQINDIGE
jgi:UDP-3-O-[3-hydroxymyristoyl] N-acetylglucosamine deacetylase